ncbi:hypothetical protein BSZ39_10795 [Bowdeniella nasicola]|uniref:TrwC relaxase domain-containing protein n=1 Tax=Bowdeniella nasicola TaxID=208480 RepID=A0A1Q5PZZ0_9ACTO|nr:hypothetical protein BSZ39_10795 [Bowdeniella nasicola]
MNMTVSMRVMSAGDGYQYLLKTVAAADGDRPLSTPLTRYYMEEGTPPGRWLGAGVAALGRGEIQVGDRVPERQLQLLMGTGCDPITGDKLGLGFPAYKSQDERIETRIAALDQTLTHGAKGESIAQIVAEETARSTRRAVAGFDFTLSIPKSASVLWEVSDAGVQALIAKAHHRAVCGGGCVHGARGCSHPYGRNRRGWRGCAGGCHRAYRDRVRSLRLSRRRSPPPYARRHQQHGQDRSRWQVALARR